MGPLKHVTNTVGRKTINPKTVLGFYATVLGLVLATTVGLVGVLAVNNVATYLIPWLLGFSGFVFVALIAGVFIVSLKDPSKLMLTQVTGMEYAQIQTLILGDSSTGDRLEVVSALENGAVVATEAQSAAGDVVRGTTLQEEVVIDVDAEDATNRSLEAKK
jgi:hypothetical protein